MKNLEKYERYADFFTRVLGWILFYYCVVKLGGWLWAGIIFGGVSASPSWWWIKDKKGN